MLKLVVRKVTARGQKVSHDQALQVRITATHIDQCGPPVHRLTHHDGYRRTQHVQTDPTTTSAT